MNLNQRLDNLTGKVLADADKVIKQAEYKYKSYYVLKNELAYAVYGILAHNIAVYMGASYQPKNLIDRLEADKE